MAVSRHAAMPPLRPWARAAATRSSAWVEEGLQLLAGERPPGRAAFVVGDVAGGVPLVADLRRVLPEAGLALSRPAVAGVAGELAEGRHRVLVGADRRMRAARRAQRRRPLLDVGRGPSPRVLAREGLETPEGLVPALHRRRRQHAALLLQAPPRQDRLEHGRLGME